MQSLDLNAPDTPGTKPVNTRLKWFNSARGFGFVIPEDREIDAFLHITTLQEAGYNLLGNGAELICRIQYGNKGALVREVIEVISAGILPNGQPVDRFTQGSDAEIEGVVKWYEPSKGFGFIVPEDGLKDVFVHRSCLRAHGIELLEPGQKIRMRVKNVPKGREVTSIQLCEAAIYGDETAETYRFMSG